MYNCRAVKCLNVYSCLFDKLQFFLTFIYTFSKPLIYFSCFSFCYKVIEYQLFQKMKHTT